MNRINRNFECQHLLRRSWPRKGDSLRDQKHILVIIPPATTKRQRPPRKAVSTPTVESIGGVLVPYHSNFECQRLL